MSPRPVTISRPPCQSARRRRAMAKTVLGTKINVQQDDIRRVFANLLTQARLAAGFKDGNALRCQISGYEVSDVLVVVDNKNAERRWMVQQNWRNADAAMAPLCRVEALSRASVSRRDQTSFGLGLLLAGQATSRGRVSQQARVADGLAAIFADAVSAFAYFFQRGRRVAASSRASCSARASQIVRFGICCGPVCVTASGDGGMRGVVGVQLTVHRCHQLAFVLLQQLRQIIYLSCGECKLRHIIIPSLPSPMMCPAAQDCLDGHQNMVG